MKLKVGDVVVVHKPVNHQGQPRWDVRMDEYDGKKGVVRIVKERGWGQVVELNFTYLWEFSSEWCTLVNDSSSDI